MVTFFYKTQAGRDVVKEYLRKLPKEERREVGYQLELLGLHGIGAPMLDVRYEGGGLYGLRVHVRSEQRVLFMTRGNELWVLYAFQKDDQKLLKRHRDAAVRRMVEVLSFK